MRQLLALLIAIHSVGISIAAWAQEKSGRLKYQYESNEIGFPIPTQDEQKFANFGEESIQAAAKYMADGALVWTRERKLIACHTTGTYLVDVDVCWFTCKLTCKIGIIDWEVNRMSISEPKVEHHEGRGIRSCPIFPELRPILDEAFEIFGDKKKVAGTFHVPSAGFNQ
ncbi:MAG: hypothetical protein NTV29_04805 [Planctomycetota bacterium]|nr:hypothetical protein [Planctomycetota bacterium]